jgi:hypothetical protein
MEVGQLRVRWHRRFRSTPLRSVYPRYIAIRNHPMRRQLRLLYAARGWLAFGELVTGDDGNGDFKIQLKGVTPPRGAGTYNFTVYINQPGATILVSNAFQVTF